MRDRSGLHHDSQPVDPATHSGTRQEQLSRLDQLEREIAVERERLNRASGGESRNDSGRQTDSAVGHTDRGDRQAGSVAHVDLPELEERVTESQREAWALGYQAGVADAQTRTGEQTLNPFHPLRG